nr:MAG TPA: MotA/TolQ/ExbB proton channel family [Caudoviricetes sp.]
MEKLRYMEKYLRNIDNLRRIANILLILGIIGTIVGVVVSFMNKQYTEGLFYISPLITSFVLYSLFNVIADISENLYEIRLQKERENNQ